MATKKQMKLQLNLILIFQKSFKSEETIWFAFFGCSIKASNYQAKFKHVAGTFLREISIKFYR